MRFKETKYYILSELKENLSSNLYYHNIAHTMDVFGAATKYAMMEDLSEHDRILVQTAALFHDSGMLRSYVNHEELSAEIAQEVLPGFAYSQSDIDHIIDMILTTKLPQSAKRLTERILCDSDLDYLGRTDFFMIALTLQHEWNVLKFRESTILEWYELQVEFLTHHEFYTPSAISLRQDQKEINLKQVIELLNHK